jgi:hypothetical protein
MKALILKHLLLFKTATLLFSTYIVILVVLVTIF